MKEEGIEVVAASVDTEELARKTVKECNVTFTMAYGLDPEFISEVTGAALTTPVFFASDISPQSRHIAIDGSRKLVLFNRHQVPFEPERCFG